LNGKESSLQPSFGISGREAAPFSMSRAGSELRRLVWQRMDFESQVATRTVHWPFSIGLCEQLRDSLQKQLGDNFASDTAKQR
jgi:hypothetical protein